MTTWVVAAERSRARIFALANPTAALVEVEDFVHPQARSKVSELVSDHAGKMPDKHQPGQHGAPSAQTATGKETDHFARELCQQLDQARERHSYRQLVLIAAPEFLGALRLHLAPATRALVVAEINKNLTRDTTTTIRGRLPPAVAQPTKN